MSRIYTTDKKIIVGDDFPQIQIGNKLFRVDTRKSNFDKLQEAIKTNSDQSDREVMKYLLGEDQLKEVDAMDLTVQGVMTLMIYLQAALYDISYEEAEARFQKSQK